MIVTLPSGELIEGMLVESDDKTVTLTIADGATRSFPLNRGPRLDIIGGVPVAATLPSGARGRGPQLRQAAGGGDAAVGRAHRRHARSSSPTTTCR